MRYTSSFGKLDGPFTLSLLSIAPIPSDLAALGEAGIRKIWHDRKLRGAGYRRVAEIIRQAGNSVGLTDLFVHRSLAERFQFDNLTIEKTRAAEMLTGLYEAG